MTLNVEWITFTKSYNSLQSESKRRNTIHLQTLRG